MKTPKNMAHENQYAQGSPFADGPTFASTYHLSGDVDSGLYQYGRFGNPTWTDLEKAIAELEDGETVVFPSGMAAIASVLTSLVKKEETILLPSDGYQPTLQYAKHYLEKFGISIKSVPTKDIPKTHLDNVNLVFIESPSNPFLDIIDIEALSQRCKISQCILIVDNTTMTPCGQTPLALGADIVISSDSKAMNGHSDLIMGHVSSKSHYYIEEARQWRKLSGNIPGPMETWLLLRSLHTLPLRIEKMTQNAEKVARFLHEHNKIKNIRYPGLPNDDSFKIAKKQMKNFGFLMTLDLGTQTKAEQFLQNSRIIYEATSFGGTHTMAERRARWGDNIGEGVVRISIGCESVEKIIDDFEKALAII